MNKPMGYFFLVLSVALGLLFLAHLLALISNTAEWVSHGADYLPVVKRLFSSLIVGLLTYISFVSVRTRITDKTDDSADSFGVDQSHSDSEGLDAGEWFELTPLNEMMDNPESMGLPAPGSSEDDIYRIASDLSSIRESFPIPEDGYGVYCPVCGIGNKDLQKLRTPCPTCGRKLLRFDLG